MRSDLEDFVLVLLHTDARQDIKKMYLIFVILLAVVKL